MQKLIILCCSVLFLLGCAYEMKIPDASEITETQNRGRFAQVKNHVGEIVYQTDRYDYEGCRVTAYIFSNSLVNQYGDSWRKLVDCSNNDYSKNLPYLLSVQYFSSSLDIYFRNLDSCNIFMKHFEKGVRIYDRCIIKQPSKIE